MIAVRGVLAKRSPETINPELPPAKSSSKAASLRLLNASQVPPFIIEDETDANENTRLKYRYLDLRRPQSMGPLLLRYRMTKLIRDYLDGLGFIDVETPVLTRARRKGRGIIWCRAASITVNSTLCRSRRSCSNRS